MSGVSSSLASSGFQITDKSSYNKMAEQSLEALSAIMTSNSHFDAPSIDKTTFGNLGVAVDNLYLYSLTSNENLFK